MNTYHARLIVLKAHGSTLCLTRLGQNRMYAHRCVYGTFSRDFTKYTVIHDVYTVLASPKNDTSVDGRRRPTIIIVLASCTVMFCLRAKLVPWHSCGAQPFV